MLANGGWDLALILLTWTIWRAPTNASKWRMGFNSAFKGLNMDRRNLTLTAINKNVWTPAHGKIEQQRQLCRTVWVNYGVSCRKRNNVPMYRIMTLYIETCCYNRHRSLTNIYIICLHKQLNKRHNAVRVNFFPSAKHRKRFVAMVTVKTHVQLTQSKCSSYREKMGGWSGTDLGL